MIEIKPIYLSSFRSKIHTILLMGYSLARPKCNCKSDEESITGLIIASIQELLQNPRSPRWLQMFSVKENQPQNNDNGITGNKRVKPDIVIEVICERRPEVIFEAKRLCRPSFPASRYLGSTGLGCFIDGHYAPRYQEAGMIGYVQSDSVLWWAKHLKSKPILSSSVDITIVPEIEHEWKSTHPRLRLTAIEIFHVLFDFTEGT